MPLGNNPNVEWTGWLIDGCSDRAEEFQKALAAAARSRNLPKCELFGGTLNMWWRKESRYIDFTSELDGTVVVTVHFQEYGTSLWIGRAVEAYASSNYYKRMATSAFVVTIDRCIRETALALVGAAALRDVSDAERK